MAAVIRLKRMGAIKKPTHRVVVMHRKSPRDGAEIEILGSYDPKTNPATVKINKERAEYWLKNGAAPSATVRSLFKKQGIKA